MPQVSVIMPVYNGARFLLEAINSILGQSFNDFELIICDDASIDRTPAILDSILDKRVRVVRNNSNLGPGPSRDRAIELARGAWLAFTDADDLWLPIRLEKLLANGNPADNVMVFDNVLECHDTPIGIVPWRILRGKKAFGGSCSTVVDVPVEKYIRSPWLLIKPIVPAAFVKAKGFRHSNRPESKEPVEDGEFFLRLMASGLQLRYVPEPLYLYRITPGSATSQAIRITSTKQILQEALIDFDHAPEVLRALHWRIQKVVTEEKYMSFFSALSEHEFRKALKLSFKFPWVIPEFLSRTMPSMIYHANRIRHGGHRRGIR